MALRRERLLILQMVAEGRLTPEEADRLIAALEGEPAPVDYGRSAAEFFTRAGRNVRERMKQWDLEELRRRTREELERARQEARRQWEEMLRTLRAGRVRDAENRFVIEIEEEDQSQGRAGR